jgi:hypothetical protein
MAAAAGGAYVAMRQEAAEVLPVAAAAVPAVAEVAQGAAPQVPSVETAAPNDPPTVRERVVEPRTVAKPAARRRAAARLSSSPAREAPRVEPAPPVSPEPPPTTHLDPVALPAPSETPQPRYVQVTVPAETVIGVQLETTVSSERSRVEDRVEGRVTRDVTVGDQIAIPAGARLIGSVTTVERGGKFRERARVAVRFHTAVLGDGTRAPITTSAIMREGASPAKETAAKVGGSAVGGAIVGAILGGAKGAVLGGTAGAGAGTAIVAAGDRNHATLAAGTQVSVRLMSELVLTLER